MFTTAASMQTLFTRHQQLLVQKFWLKPLLLRKKTYWSCSKPHFKASQGRCETVLTRDLIKTSVFGRKWRYSRWEEGPDLKEWNLSVKTNEFRPVAEELRKTVIFSFVIFFFSGGVCHLTGKCQIPFGQSSC